MLMGKVSEYLSNIKIRIEELLSVDGRLGYILRRISEIFLGNNSSYKINDLAEWLELPILALKPWLNEIPSEYEYDNFKVPKKSGRGRRDINAPNNSLKVLQRSVYHKLLKRLHLHQAATAYILGRSIFDNALPHIRQEVVINIDLKDFFGSISSDKVYRYWHFLGWDVETSIILKNICCYKGSLPQGSPTSPALSNLCNQLLDARLEGLAKRNKGQYTRYSDDLTFSFSNPYIHKRGILEKIRQILDSEGYEIQEKKKIRIQRSHQRQTTTGLVVNDKVNLPKEMRKRIRAMRHHLSKGTLLENDIQRLTGYESLLKMIGKVNTTDAPRRIELNRLFVASSPPLNHSDPHNMNTVLFLASSPVDEARLRLDKEAHQIDEGLRRANKREQFKLEQRWAIGTDSLRRALLDIAPQIVHFSGHGLGVNGILVEDDSGMSKLISTAALAELFGLCSDHIECVLLNACYSEVQATAIAQHINYVIGMSDAIGDNAAIKFTTGFYDALGAGKSIELAFKFGCNAIHTDNIPEHLIPKIKRKFQN
jgi:retron-type reverse transcriptase